MQSDSVTLPSDPAAVAAQVKLATFSAINAPTWFRRAEVQFCLKRITSSMTQANHWMKSKGDIAIEYSDLKTFLLQRFTLSAASRVTQLLQLSKQPLGDQRSSEALLEMKALARLPTVVNGSERKLDLLRAIWLLLHLESIRAVLSGAERMDDDDLQQMAECLSDAQPAADRHINAAPYASSTAPPPPKEDDIAAINHAQARAH
ncbi:hypothetical protein E2C01_054697 [Portunus trituberculatus]|uniref:Uncharacterized protein n=1 Tax=Portunus trituberculatus TaxID=210409 RepID=A0A5B7GPC5_PORTR|nr:hypothetical protein [Portunus trituberculatus]